MDCEGFFQGFDNPRSIPDPLNSNCGSDFKDVNFFVHFLLFWKSYMVFPLVDKVDKRCAKRDQK